MHHPHKLIIYSRNSIHKAEEKPHQFNFKTGDTEISKNSEYSDVLHTYCDADHDIYISDRRSVTSIVHPFNGTIIF